MKLSSFEAIIEALNGAGVRYLVVGGLAVNAHGFLRMTLDVDLVIRLQREDILAAFMALQEIGYLPSVPVSPEEFADPVLRERFRAEKNMSVLKFWSDSHRETPLDIFVYHPFDFDEEYSRAMTRPLNDDILASFVSIPALIAMKRVAGRDQDLIDIAKLERIAELQSHGRQNQ
jgi:hypothetical protein